MNTKNIYVLIVSLILTIGFGLTSCNESLPNNNSELITDWDDEENGGEDPSTKPDVDIPSAKGITDLVLMYHTHPERPKWSAKDVKNYIYRPNLDGSPDWMFDGFLFLEFKADKQGETFTFEESEYWKSADQSLWEWLANEMFSTGRAADALEQVLGELAEKGYLPPYKRQVVFGVPYPKYGVKTWGLINDKRMDFSNLEDRVAAVEWYINKLIENWNAKNYKHLDLAGFYWTKEEMAANVDDNPLLVEIGKIVNAKGYDFSWIPYYGAKGADMWKENGFNFAYQQPNHFFSTETPDWFLPESIKYAKTYGLYMEMEFDERVEDPAFGSRFHKYIDEFEKAGIWDDVPVAYYHGNNAWHFIADSYHPDLIAMHKRLGDIIAKRQGRFSQIIPK